MKIINNKGVGAVVGYKIYSDSEVLSSSSIKSLNAEFLAQMPIVYDKGDKVDITLLSRNERFETFEVKITGTGQGSKDIRDFITRRGVKRIDESSNGRRVTSVVRPVIKNGKGFFSFTLIAYPNTLTFYVDSPKSNIQAIPGKIPSGWAINGKMDGLDRVVAFRNPAIVDVTFKGTQGKTKNEIYEVKVSGTGSGAKMIREIITRNGVVRLDGKDYNQTNVTVLKPVIASYPGYFTFTVVALPTTLTFFVNSPNFYVDAEPGKIPSGWKINGKMDGLDRIRK